MLENGGFGRIVRPVSSNPANMNSTTTAPAPSSDQPTQTTAPGPSAGPAAAPEAGPAATTEPGPAATDATPHAAAAPEALESLPPEEEIAALSGMVTQLQAQLAESQAQLTAAQTALREAQEQFLRAKAETDNVRRRAAEDEQKARKFAIEAFADSMLPVRDSLEAALNVPNQTPEGLRAGVEATLKQLTHAFERHKLVEIVPAVGDKLDPHRHQAISAVPAEQEPNTVVTVLQKGYLLAERTLRPALVTVAAPK
jgi:molecular chaperone GrpE